ncbi:MAG: lipoyl(octanoyl) transferase LipB [Candidatus Omnitrophica bacterium]|nr:lipoyl(octanoyl) transferase LipB [Candidatus Omnitrophota bacterium]
MRCKSIDLGLTDFREAYKFQRQCLEEVKSGSSAGFLLFTEHRPVFTMGRFAKRDNLLIDEETAKARGIDIVKTDRGGDITFHGPGQMVAYPVFDLKKGIKDVHRFLSMLEDVAISCLKEFGIPSHRIKGRTGAWTDKGKIASIGIGVSKWVTFHGIAINANVDLDYFNMINPCGFKDIKVTSMKEMLGKEIDLPLLKDRLIKQFQHHFNIELVPATPIIV